MIGVILLVSSIPTIQCIIVTDPPPTELDYKYSYNVEDPSTGDSKSQHEVRYGDTVTSAYSVLDPDGTKRTVQYSADSKHGFKAVIKQEPIYNIQAKPQQYMPNGYINYRYEPELGQQQEYTNGKPVIELSQNVIDQLGYYAKAEGYGHQDVRVYFTPENEVPPQEHTNRGQYFTPAHNR
ncbi:uncharacterized protein LOC128678257 [Plodia interpunctella]|uniref:uncharacterized protein LOC128678257 n=1 Tax=Plodia interpunctella TaxID=58824 RepID=UPI002367D549|nr:uncharacterized protein LOC128678257 [Plodia interpunctella]